MKLSDFDYKFPKELIAQRPLKDRDASRMMVVDRSAKSSAHSKVSELPGYLQRGDLVIFNDSKVIPARLFGKRGGQDLELLVVEPAPEGKNLWRCLTKKAKRIRPGEKIFFGMQTTAVAKGRDDIYLLVEFKSNSLELAIEHHGVPPLPPYIEREGLESYTAEDRERYQTIYAKKSGSAAAPTAGLHFSDALIKTLEDAGIFIEHITLHVGIDTFTPVRVDDLSEHRMHGERVKFSKKTAEAIARAKSEGRRIIAVGTTTVRALESAALPIGAVTSRESRVACNLSRETRDARRITQGAGSGELIAHGEWTTDLFIKPNFKFKIVDAMLTNFHLPKSTLLMMVAAFAGREFILSCYEEAIREKYRLFSYGDCMLIL